MPNRLSPRAQRLVPADTAEQARFPVGLHVIAQGGTMAVFRARYADRDPACAWADAVVAAWQGDRLIGTVPVQPGEHEVMVDLCGVSGPVHLYPPAHLRPVLLGNAAQTAPVGTRIWLAYGDSITGAWSCPTPGGDWVSRSGRGLGVEAVNLGFAGAARGELAVATDIAETPADLISVAFGTNCWSLVPHSAAALRDVTRDFLAEIRQGHPKTPIVVISPIVRPAAETSPNVHGATLADLRSAIETAAQDRTGDKLLMLVPGKTLIPEDLLCDGIHPAAEGHALYSATVGPLLATALEGVNL